MEQYDSGEDPSTLPVPTLTKELLVEIIRLCPIVEQDRVISSEQGVSKTSTLLTGLGVREI